MINQEKVFEILENTGLNWTVEKDKLYRNNANTFIPTETFGLFRNDTNTQLHRGVAEGYNVYQNSQLVTDLVDCVGDHLQIDNINSIKGGLLQNGKKVHVSFPIGIMNINGNDKIKRYVTFTNAHDGSSSVGIGMSNTVVSCSNSFFGVVKQLNTVKHTANMMANIEKLKLNLSNVLEKEKILMEKFDEMTRIEIQSEQAVKDLIENLIPHTDPEIEISTRKLNQRDDLLLSIQKEMSSKGYTEWGLFNGVTHYTNHVQAKEDKKDYNVMVGQGYKMNKRALELI